MSFRYPIQAYQKQPGHYDQGVWVEGSLTPITIQATVQPASQSDYDKVQATIGGRWTESMMRVYSDQRLDPAHYDDSTGQMSNGDEVDYDGDRYLVIGMSPWQSGVISHYRMLIARKVQP